jgi:hypothetical protein
MYSSPRLSLTFTVYCTLSLTFVTFFVISFICLASFFRLCLGMYIVIFREIIIYNFSFTYTCVSVILFYNSIFDFLFHFSFGQFCPSILIFRSAKIADSFPENKMSHGRTFGERTRYFLYSSYDKFNQKIHKIFYNLFSENIYLLVWKWDW